MKKLKDILYKKEFKKYFLFLFLISVSRFIKKYEIIAAKLVFLLMKRQTNEDKIKSK